MSWNVGKALEIIIVQKASEELGNILDLYLLEGPLDSEGVGKTIS